MYGAVPDATETPMGYEVRYLADERIVEATYSGELTREELGEALRAHLALAIERRADRLLADCRDLRGGHHFVDLIDLIESLPAGGTLRLREAVVLPTAPGARELVEFWETACLNRGFDVRLFESPAEAVAWLRSFATHAA